LIVCWPEITAIARGRPVTGLACAAVLIAVIALGLIARLADYTTLIF
jgi:hypothetical protein